MFIKIDIIENCYLLIDLISCICIYGFNDTMPFFTSLVLEIKSKKNVVNLNNLIRITQFKCDYFQSLSLRYSNMVYS